MGMAEPPRHGPWHPWFAWRPVRTDWHGWTRGGTSTGWDYRPRRY